MGGGQSLFSTEVILDECCVIIIERCWPSGGIRLKCVFLCTLYSLKQIDHLCLLSPRIVCVVVKSKHLFHPRSSMTTSYSQDEN